jgi:hypothetical protein
VKALFMVALAMMLLSNTLYADWDFVRRLPADSRIEIATKNEPRERVTLVSSSAESLVVRDKSNERAVQRTEIRKIGVFDESRKTHKGLLWTAVGAGGGAAVGIAVCPQCPNEGAGNKALGPGVAIGAIAGAIFGFVFHSSYRTIYKNR